MLLIQAVALLHYIACAFPKVKLSSNTISARHICNSLYLMYAHSVYQPAGRMEYFVRSFNLMF